MRIIETARKRILNGNGVNPFFLDLNGSTIRLKVDQGFGAGSVGLADFDTSGKVYTAYDQTMWEAVTGSVNYDPLIDFTSVCTTLVTNMSSAFFNVSFNENISHFDTANVIDMQEMFNLNQVFNKPLNDWDVSKVTNFNNMFAGASFPFPIGNIFTIFNQPLNNWNTSSATNMNGMFNQNNVFNQDLTSWCVEQIPSEPTNFAEATFLPANRPNFGDPC